MLTRPVRAAVSMAGAASLVLGLAAAPAWAQDPINPVKCANSPRDPHCRVGVGKPGRPPSRTDDDGDGGSGSGGTSDAGADDGCKTVLVGTDPPPGVTGPGGWYSTVCTNGQLSSQTQPQWVPDGGALALDPAVLARQAVSMLHLPRLTVQLSPAAPAPQVVNVATWFWVDPDGWKPRSATASVPGMSVTATATPVSAQWVTGQGKPETCAGPGTPFTKGMDPTAASPTCGYTYQAPSDAAPGGVFPLRVTVTWQVRWVGAGQTGTAGPLTTTATIAVTVREAPAVNSGASR